MAESIRGNKTLSGTWGELWIDGEKIFEFSKIELKVTANREDVQIGIDVDSKITGLKGEGSYTVKKVYTRAKAILESWKKGKDVRCQIIAKLKDPDAVNGQTERWSANNVWHTELPVVNWEKGGIVEEETRSASHRLICRTWIRLQHKRRKQSWIKIRARYLRVLLTRRSSAFRRKRSENTAHYIFRAG